MPISLYGLNVAAETAGRGLGGYYRRKEWEDEREQERMQAAIERRRTRLEGREFEESRFLRRRDEGRRYSQLLATEKADAATAKAATASQASKYVKARKYVTEQIEDSVPKYGDEVGALLQQMHGQIGEAEEAGTPYDYQTATGAGDPEQLDIAEIAGVMNRFNVAATAKAAAEKADKEVAKVPSVIEWTDDNGVKRLYSRSEFTGKGGVFSNLKASRDRLEQILLIEDPEAREEAVKKAGGWTTFYALLHQAHRDYNKAFEKLHPSAGGGGINTLDQFFEEGGGQRRAPF
ncbi:hypothetical protein LCGC14_0412330 [marine sediment metagenome]|uniref:Uncharacterized protein n=1 Tax=marine sediment metagenome TaxID=412755 RepID=A0A0F9TBG9_9ZZZZ